MQFPDVVFMDISPRLTGFLEEDFLPNCLIKENYNQDKNTKKQMTMLP